MKYINIFGYVNIIYISIVINYCVFFRLKVFTYNYIIKLNIKKWIPDNVIWE